MTKDMFHMLRPILTEKELDKVWRGVPPGERIKKLCADRDMTLRQLADKIEVHPVTIYNICAGRIPGRAIQKKIAKALKVKFDELWG